MITKITSENYGSYKALFEQASKELGTVVPDLDAYMAKMEELRAIEADEEHIYDHHFTILPLDEPPLAVDANSRQIEIPKEFKKNGLAVIGDHLAEMVLFSIDRYYDTWDLLGEGMKAIVQWNVVQAGKDVKLGISPITYVDATILANERKLLFGWPIDNSITEHSGTIKFSIRFYKIVEIKGENHLVFSMNTIPTTLDIKTGLNFMDDKSFNKETTDISNIFEQRFNNGFGYVNGNGADTPWVIIPLSIYEDEIVTPVFGPDEDQSEPKNYDLKLQEGQGGEEDSYKLTIGLSSGGNGKVTYSVLSTESSTAEPTYPVYFETKDSVVDTAKVYYTYDSEIDDYVPVTSNIDFNSDENYKVVAVEEADYNPANYYIYTADGYKLCNDAEYFTAAERAEEYPDFVENFGLPYNEDYTYHIKTIYYEAIDCYDITKVGTYWIRSTNSVEPASTKHKDSGRIRIPGPATPTFTADKSVYLKQEEVDGELKYSLSIPITGYSEQEDDKLEYILRGFEWGSEQPPTITLDEQNLDSGEEYEFKIDNITGGEGDFSINKYDVTFFPTIKSYRNGSVAELVITDPKQGIRATHRPEVPVVEITSTSNKPGATLSVTVTNEAEILSDRFIYKWCKRTEDTTDDDSINPDTKEAWGTEDTFVPTSNGYYYCLVSNEVNNAVSAPAETITVTIMSA